MISPESKLRNTLGVVVREHFPELAMLPLSTTLMEGDDDELSGYGHFLEGGYYVDVHPRLAAAPLRVIRGGIAHELAHIALDEKGGFLARRRDDVVYHLGANYLPKGRKLPPLCRFMNKVLYRPCHDYIVSNERAADLMVVERDAGEDLLAYLQFHQKHGMHKMPDYGLNVHELETLLR